MEPSALQRSGKEEVKFLDIFGKMPEIFRGHGVGKILTFSSDERIFGKSQNRFSTISGRNIDHDFQELEGSCTLCKLPLCVFIALEQA